MAYLIIDGYNLLAVSGFSNRDKLISALAQYRKEKKHEVTVVFDGTHTGTGSGDRYHVEHVEVIFSPITVQADDMIEEMLNKVEPSRTIVISSDRRIQSAALRSNATYVTSQEFSRRLKHSTSGSSEMGTPPWMEGREDEDAKPSSSKGRKLPKDERRRQQNLKKL